jgi:hypothetical protein
MDENELTNEAFRESIDGERSESAHVELRALAGPVLTSEPPTQTSSRSPSIFSSSPFVNLADRSAAPILALCDCRAAANELIFLTAAVPPLFPGAVGAFDSVTAWNWAFPLPNVLDAALRVQATVAATATALAAASATAAKSEDGAANAPLVGATTLAAMSTGASVVDADFWSAACTSFKADSTARSVSAATSSRAPPLLLSLLVR